MMKKKRSLLLPKGRNEATVETHGTQNSQGSFTNMFVNKASERESKRFEGSARQIQIPSTQEVVTKMTSKSEDRVMSGAAAVDPSAPSQQ
jgi:hypothetical protein